jgi:hypothetical protein
LHAAPPGVIYGTWWFTVARDDPFRRVWGTASTPLEILRFVVIGVAAAFDGLGQIPGVGLVLAGVLVIGLALSWRPGRSDGQRARAAVPTALLAGALVFLVLAGLGRGRLGVETARSSRYLHIVVALVLPAVAVSLEAFARRRHWVSPIAIGLLVMSVPGNVESFVDARQRQEAAFQRNRRLVLSLPRVPAAKQVPRDVQPFDRGKGEHAWAVTVGWLLDGVATGRIPDPGPIDSRTKAELEDRLQAAAFKYAIAQALTPEQRRAGFQNRSPQRVTDRPGAAAPSSATMSANSHRSRSGVYP